MAKWVKSMNIARAAGVRFLPNSKERNAEKKNIVT